MLEAVLGPGVPGELAPSPKNYLNMVALKTGTPGVPAVRCRAIRPE